MLGPGCVSTGSPAHKASLAVVPALAQNTIKIGMITDRDIAVRAVAAGLDGNTPVRQVMSSNVRYCFDDEDVEHVAANMADIQVRRLPVLNREKRLVGVVSLGNIASGHSRMANDTVLRGVTSAH